jgi:hypothetical protein
VLIRPSILPLSPSTRNARPSAMLKKLKSLTHTQWGFARAGSCSTPEVSFGSGAAATGPPTANPRASSNAKGRTEVLIDLSPRTGLPPRNPRCTEHSYRGRGGFTSASSPGFPRFVQ